MEITVTKLENKMYGLDINGKSILTNEKLRVITERIEQYLRTTFFH